MEAGDLVFTEVREHLGNTFSHLHYALLVVGSNYKAIDVDHGEFLLLPVGAYKKSFEDIKELHSIDWQVHIDMVEPSERLGKAVDIVSSNHFRTTSRAQPLKHSMRSSTRFSSPDTSRNLGKSLAITCMPMRAARTASGQLHRTGPSGSRPS